jgi:hypothetical protein
MTSAQRRNHRVVFIILAPLLAAGIVAGLGHRRPLPVQEPPAAAIRQPAGSTTIPHPAGDRP